MGETGTGQVLQKNEYKALLFVTQENTRDYAIIMLFLQAGLRVSELVSLSVDDIDLENGLLYVRQSKGAAYLLKSGTFGAETTAIFGSFCAQTASQAIRVSMLKVPITVTRGKLGKMGQTRFFV